MTPATISGGGSTQGVSVITSDRDGGEGVTGKLAQVQAIQFLRDKRDIGDDLTDEERKEKELEPRPSTIQYGLAADQLKAVYPELVYEDKEGNVSINYIEIIPLLVQSINELSSELAELKGTSNKKSKAKTQTTAIEDAADDMDQVRMDQNKPNPFSESTVIKLNIPKDTKTANIYIYDFSGKPVQSVPVTERGETDITVYASDLSAGMYIYSLVTDGQVKLTRRMMVTE
ncbi:MAG: T9SS type A sorting domain-containing protein [Bacteroidaceae bacterium]|nr:T9SS type A sorting domain-containing protein [Bacteroidaceae bacterium]